MCQPCVFTESLSKNSCSVYTNVRHFTYIIIAYLYKIFCHNYIRQYESRHHHYVFVYALTYVMIYAWGGKFYSQLYFFIKIRQITSIPCGSKAQPCLTFFLKIRQENVNAYNMLHDNNCLSNFLSNFFQKTKFFRQNTKIKKFFTNFFGVK